MSLGLHQLFVVRIEWCVVIETVKHIHHGAVITVTLIMQVVPHEIDTFDLILVGLQFLVATKGTTTP
jgi:hypothetical protein